MSYTDDQITAFLDGELPPGEMATMSALRASDPVFAKQVSRLELNMAALKDAFGSLQEPDAKPQDMRRSSAWGLVQWGALAAAMAVATFAGYRLAPQPAGDSWQMEVAHYQALYVAETLAGIKPEPARLASELERAGALLDLDFDLESLSQIQGLTLRRAQVLGYQGRPLIQIAFTDDAGAPFALCILKTTGPQASDTGAVSALKVETLMALAAASWQSPDHGFLIIGGDNQTGISDYAAQLSALF